MRVTLVDNLLLEQRGESYTFDLQPHLGLISLLATLRETGHSGVLVDPKLEVNAGRLALDGSLYERLARTVLATAPDVVGFTSLGCNFIATAKIAAHVKSRHPDLPVLLGGPHASILDVPVLDRFPQFDVVVRGEAELTLPPLLDALSGGSFSALHGISYRDGGQVRRGPDAPMIADLDTLPPAAYDHYPVAELGLTMLRVEAGRGCPFACTFCSTARFFGRRYRLRSADRLCADLDRLNREYGLAHFGLTHDLFTVNKAKVHEFCDAVEPRGYTWSCSARMDCVDEKLLRRMSEAGCRSIYYGVETGSPRMQRVVSKRLDLSLFWPTLEATRKADIEATTSFITGYPQEEAADQAMTLDLIGDLWRRRPETVAIQLHLLTPEPGTELLDEFRAELDYDGHVSDFNLPSLEPDDAEVMRQDPEIFVNHQYYRSVLPRRRHILVTSLHPVLYRLGFPVQRYLLGRYEGRLSRFFDDVLRWVEAGEEEPPYGAELLHRYLEARWGTADHLLSLVRYMLVATDPARARPTRSWRHQGPVPGRTRGPDWATEGAAEDGAASGTRFRLSPRAALLSDLHPCPEILALLHAAEAPESVEVPPPLTTRTGAYVLLPGTDAGSVRNFAVSEETATLLTYLARPRLGSEVAAYVGVTAADRARLDTFLDQMAAAGILERSARLPGRPRREPLGSAVPVAGT
jgi:radical SAM superfamily enzyme YgiQ (UPF0313 family)